MKTPYIPTLTIADIFKEHIGSYLKEHNVNSEQHKVIRDILSCQTSECGMHARVCTDCGVIDYAFNSCRNRHCPNCQDAKKSQWIEERKKDLLPVTYFHLVFTIPQELNPIFLYNKETCYRMLFESVWKTIQHFSAHPKWLGAQAGCIALLHTWGQSLSFHPHIHCIMPGGGLTSDGFEWIHTRSNFFAPVNLLSEKFKDELLKRLVQEKEKLKLPFIDTEFDKTLNGTRKINWVVFAQPSFTAPDYVIDYLGNYTHKIAISNYRLIKIENNLVYFKWKDYKDGSKMKVMHLPVFEFIRRFLEHVLPYNFYKIRHYGIFANRFRSINIAHAKECLMNEGKVCEISNKKEDFKSQLPEGCPYMGRCIECGGATISYYHYYNLVVMKEKYASIEILSQTG